MTRLDICWKNCLRMWKWVSENYDGTSRAILLKMDWLNAHRFKKPMVAMCFFCDWASAKGQTQFHAHKGCPECPGALVDPSFKCGHDAYDYALNPKAFYAELLRLDAIRKDSKTC